MSLRHGKPHVLVMPRKIQMEVIPCNVRGVRLQLECQNVPRKSIGITPAKIVVLKSKYRETIPAKIGVLKYHES